jgi:hypothetical protein
MITVETSPRSVTTVEVVLCGLPRTGRVGAMSEGMRHPDEPGGREDEAMAQSLPSSFR